MDKETTNKFIEEIKETFNQSFGGYLPSMKDYYLKVNSSNERRVNFTLVSKRFGECVKLSISYSYVLWSAKTISDDFLTDLLAVECWQRFHNALIEKIRSSK